MIKDFKIFELQFNPRFDRFDNIFKKLKMGI